MSQPASAEVQHEVERFLHEEAALIDDRRLHEWLALFTDDAVYRMELRSKILQHLPPNMIARYGEALGLTQEELKTLPPPVQTGER